MRCSASHTASPAESHSADRPPKLHAPPGSDLAAAESDVAAGGRESDRGLHEQLDLDRLAGAGYLHKPDHREWEMQAATLTEAGIAELTQMISVARLQSCVGKPNLSKVSVPRGRQDALLVRSCRDGPNPVPRLGRSLRAIRDVTADVPPRRIDHCVLRDLE